MVLSLRERLSSGGMESDRNRSMLKTLKVIQDPKVDERVLVTNWVIVVPDYYRLG